MNLIYAAPGIINIFYLTMEVKYLNEGLAVSSMRLQHRSFFAPLSLWTDKLRVQVKQVEAGEKGDSISEPSWI